MNGFIDTENDFRWQDDEDGSRLRAFERQCEKDGFVPIPDDQPVPDPEDRYEFRFWGPIAYYRPKGGAS